MKNESIQDAFENVNIYASDPFAGNGVAILSYVDKDHDFFLNFMTESKV